jgi:hypothetical protein
VQQLFKIRKFHEGKKCPHLLTNTLAECSIVRFLTYLGFSSLEYLAIFHDSSHGYLKITPMDPCLRYHNAYITLSVVAEGLLPVSPHSHTDDTAADSMTVTSTLLSHRPYI